jgi:predicted ester cyclase
MRTNGWSDLSSRRRSTRETWLSGTNLPKESWLRRLTLDQPVQGSFPDFTMRIVDLLAEDDTVVGHFRCSGTHAGEWNGIPATGKRFHDIDEIYIFRVCDGKLTAFAAVEDNFTRLRPARVRGPAI